MNVTFERREAIRAIRHFRPGRAPGASESDEIAVGAGAGSLIFSADGFQAGIEAFVMEPGIMFVPREYFDRLLRRFKEERLTLQASPEGFQIGHYPAECPSQERDEGVASPGSICHRRRVTISTMLDRDAPLQQTGNKKAFVAGCTAWNLADVASPGFLVTPPGGTCQRRPPCGPSTLHGTSTPVSSCSSSCRSG
jgi:hypothetical protein